MPIFSKGSDHEDLLRQILQELGELRQQIDHQQHAVDQARQDAIAATNSGLAEIRAVVREGLNRSTDSLRDPLVHVSTELVALRASVDDLHRVRPAADPPAAAASVHEAGAADEADTADTADEAGHRDLLRRAAGISAATLRVHRDTWAFLVEHAGQDKHFHIPGAVQESGGGITVEVSGRSLVAALTSLRGVQHAPAVDPGTAAIADLLCERIATTVRSLTATTHPDSRPVHITVDDRVPPANDHNKPPDRPTAEHDGDGERD
ncbi:hypothetical protein [Streptomyces silvensis]|uniref:Uncharacterized protein n=1 Tax=Streptomyces silvensis TaxID=1765722 RepID=A0A0W7WVJ9_9ACTN|nr:hypothetical protein [Streptomyces silvensis]KUF14610.1 hypothetical protein AT728_28705 [Streptomyces silvensis]